MVPAKGLGFKVYGSWWNHYESARKDAGLAAIDSPDQSKIVLWPRKDREGNWTMVSCTSEDHSTLLRQILLTLGWSTEQVAGMSSHSCKATAISFCSKFGMAEEDRKILAYHLSKGSSTIKCYSRDVMASPLRQMAKIFEEIRVGTFLPSDTRANMFPQDDGEPVVDIRQRYYGLMEQLTNERVADEVGSEVSSERNFSDLSDYDAQDKSGNQPTSNRSDRASDDGPDFGDTEVVDDEVLEIEGDAADQLPSTDLPHEFAVEDELGIAEGSVLNTAALEAVSQVEPEEKGVISRASSDQSSSSSSSDSSSSEAHSETFEKLMRSPGLGASASCSEAPVIENPFKVRGGKYHLCSANSETHFACGTRITPRASRQITSPAFFSPKCPRCFVT